MIALPVLVVLVLIGVSLSMLVGTLASFDEEDDEP